MAKKTNNPREKLLASPSRFATAVAVAVAVAVADASFGTNQRSELKALGMSHWFAVQSIYEH